MRGLRNELEGLRARIATLRGPEGCAGSGYWSPDTIHGPGHITGSPESDPDVMAGRACACWPPSDWTPAERAEQQVKDRAQMFESARVALELNAQPRACVARCGECRACQPADPRGSEVARCFLETGRLEWPEGASSSGWHDTPSPATGEERV
jgi:hypothetical protein